MPRMMNDVTGQSLVMFVGAAKHDVCVLKESRAYSELPINSADIMEVDTSRSESDGIHSPQKRLCHAAAAVFVLTPAAMECECFRHWMEQAALEAYRRVDFRCYVLFHRMDQETFFNLEGPASRTVSCIKMGVHVSGIQDSDIIMRHLKDHIIKAPELNRRYRQHVVQLQRQANGFDMASSMKHGLFLILLMSVAFRGAMWSGKVPILNSPFATYFVIFDRTSLRLAINAGVHPLIALSLLFVLGYMSRTAWVILSAVRVGRLSLSVGKIISTLGFLVIVIPIVFFARGLSLPLQLIALMTPIAGWLAHRFAAGSNDLPPVWSLITDSPVVKEYP